MKDEEYIDFSPDVYLAWRQMWDERGRVYVSDKLDDARGYVLEGEDESCSMAIQATLEKYFPEYFETKRTIVII